MSNKKSALLDGMDSGIAEEYDTEMLSDDEVVAVEEIDVEDIDDSDEVVLEEEVDSEVLDFSSAVVGEIVADLMNQDETLELTDEQINKILELDSKADSMPVDELKARINAIAYNKVFTVVKKSKIKDIPLTVKDLTINKVEEVVEEIEKIDCQPINEVNEPIKLPLTGYTQTGPVIQEDSVLGPIDNQPVEDLPSSIKEESIFANEDRMIRDMEIEKLANDMLRGMMNEEEIEELDSIDISKFELEVVQDKAVIHIPVVEFKQEQGDKTKLYEMFDKQTLTEIVNQNHTILEVLTKISPEFDLNTKDAKTLTNELVRTILNLKTSHKKVMAIVSQNKQLKVEYKKLSELQETTSLKLHNLENETKELQELKANNIQPSGRYVFYIGSRKLYICIPDGKSAISVNDFSGTQDMFEAMKFKRETASQFLDLLLDQCTILTKEDLDSVEVQQIYVGR